jgi:hypothetical protein
METRGKRAGEGEGEGEGGERGEGRRTDRQRDMGRDKERERESERERERERKREGGGGEGRAPLPYIYRTGPLRCPLAGRRRPPTRPPACIFHIMSYKNNAVLYYITSSCFVFYNVI